MYACKLEWAAYAVQAKCDNLAGKRAHTQLVENARPQSSRLAEPLWTDAGLKSGIGVRELVSTQKKNKNKGHAGIDPSSLAKNPCLRRKSHHPHHHVCMYVCVCACTSARVCV